MLLRLLSIHEIATLRATRGDHNDHVLLWLEAQIDAAAIAAEVAYYGHRVSE